MEDQNSCKPPVFRGDSFLINLGMLCDSVKANEIIKRFYSRHLEIEKNDVSYRVLTHWDSLGLIEYERDSSQGWRRFNLIETLWLSVIKKARELGVSLDQMTKVKSSFFQKISPNDELAFIDYYLIGAIFMKFPTFFVIFPEGHGEFLSYEDLDVNFYMGAIESHISIFLNPLLNQILPKKIEWSFPLQQTVSAKQAQIIDLMNNEDFDYLHILKKKNELTDVKIIKNFSGSTKEPELKEDHNNVSIETHYENGGITTKKRTIHKKL
jgi:DNA-binding transcriptional MerR regulator